LGSEESKGPSRLEKLIGHVFQNEELRSLIDVRLAIEEEFDHNLKSDRDLLAYLKSRLPQKSHPKAQNPYTSMLPRGRRAKSNDRRMDSDDEDE
jgi:hypothetical protein